MAQQEGEVVETGDGTEADAAAAPDGAGPKKAEEHGGRVNPVLVDVEVVGTFPLLTDAMSEEKIVEVLIRRGRKPAVTDLSLNEMAGLTLYLGPNGELGIPVWNLYSCFIQGGTTTKLDGRRMVSTEKATRLGPLVQIVEPKEFIPFTHLGDPAWKPDVRRGTNRASGDAVGIVRAKFPTWGLAFTVRVNQGKNGFTLASARKLVENAGDVGLGAFRSTCRGPFGQFRIESWGDSRPVE